MKRKKTMTLGERLQKAKRRALLDHAVARHVANMPNVTFNDRLNRVMFAGQMYRKYRTGISSLNQFKG